jgi:hypothetical protein
MKTILYEGLALLRTAIGYLGEREQYAWWQSSFFNPASRAFLTPVFARTQLLAQYAGVTQAATIVHDERIGVGHVYHLFRLPEDLEQRMHRLLHDPAIGERTTTLVANKDAALAFLSQQAEYGGSTSIGPTRIGPTKDLLSARSWSMAASCYLDGFNLNHEIYPYFTDAV